MLRAILLVIVVALASSATAQDPLFVGLLPISVPISFILPNTTPYAWIGPQGVYPPLRDPFKPNIFNLRTSQADEVATLVNVLTGHHRFSRIGIIYLNDSYYGPICRDSTVSLLKYLGLKPVAEVIVQWSDLSRIDPIEQQAWYNASFTVAQGKPQAVLIFALSPVVVTVLGSLYTNQLLSPGSVVAIGTLGTEYLLDLIQLVDPGFVTRYTFYAAHFMPPLSDTTNPLVAQFLAAADAINPWIARYDFQVLESYLNARFAVELLQRTAVPLAGQSVSPVDLVQAAYDNPLFYFGNKRLGPFSKDCSAPVGTLFHCCNQGLRSMFVMTLSYNNATGFGWVNHPELEFRWSTSCGAMASRVQAPIVFGQSYPFGDPIGDAVRAGISAAFAEKNAEGGFYGRRLYLVSFDDGDDTGQTAENTRELIVFNQVIGLAGYVGYDAAAAALAAAAAADVDSPLLVGTVSGAMKKLREPFAPNIINVRASYRDEVAGVLSALSTTSARIGLFRADSTPGKEVEEAIEDAIDSGRYDVDKLVDTAKFPAKYGDNPARSEVASAITRAVSKLSSSTLDAVVVFAPTKIAAQFALQWRANNDIPVYVLSLADAVLLHKALQDNGYYAALPGSDTLLFTSSIVNNPLLAATYNSSAVDFVDRYTAAMDAYYADSDWTPTAASLEGYLVGRFIVAVIERINGNITASTFQQAVYDTVVFNVEGTILGEFADEDCADADKAVAGSRELACCNQGAHVTYVAPLPPLAGNNASQSEWPAFVFDTCGVQFGTTSGDVDSSSGLDRHTIGIIVGVVVGVGGAVLVGMAAVAVILLRRGRRDRRVRLRQPNYEKLALAAARDTMARARMTELLLDDLPMLDHRAQHRILSRFESLLMNVENMRFFLFALRKTEVEMGETCQAVALLYHRHRRANELLLALAGSEIADVARQSNAATLFRQDNALSKIFKVYTKLVGLPFLFNAFGVHMAELEELTNEDAEARKRRPSNASQSDLDSASTSSSSPRRTARLSVSLSMEIDPERMDKRDNQFVNSLQLKLAAQKIFLSVVESVSSKFPLELREFFHGVWHLMETLEGGRMAPHTTQAIAGFLFLRYICPAITTPHQHGLFQNTPTVKAQRFLVLLSKVLQNLANGCQFEKEEYMKPLNDFIVENLSVMNTLLKDLSTTRAEDTAKHTHSVEVDDDLKDGAVTLLFHQVAQFKDRIIEQLKQEKSTPKLGIPTANLEDMEKYLPGLLAGTAVAL